MTISSHGARASRALSLPCAVAHLAACCALHVCACVLRYMHLVHAKHVGDVLQLKILRAGQVGGLGGWYPLVART